MIPDFTMFDLCEIRNFNNFDNMKNYWKVFPLSIRSKPPVAYGNL